jgi:hypothetical protein
VAAPFRELRFTRSRQSVHFAAAGICLAAIAAGILYVGWQRIEDRPAPWLALLPLGPALWCFWMAVRLARHAYVLLSPLGIEIFPLFRAEERLQLIPWSEVAHAGVDEARQWLTITLAAYEDAKVLVSLAPMDNRVRPLLAAAVDGVMARRAAGSAGDS